MKFPKLKVVLIESGVTWMPPYLWRLSKFWRGVRNEVPWIDRPPEAVCARPRAADGPAV